MIKKFKIDKFQILKIEYVARHTPVHKHGIRSLEFETFLFNM